MHRVVTMSLNSRWRLAHLGMCATALFAHGQQMNIGSSFPSYLKRLRVSCSTVVAQPPYEEWGNEHGQHAAFDPNSTRRLRCCRDRCRAFVSGCGNGL